MTCTIAISSSPVFSPTSSSSTPASLYCKPNPFSRVPTSVNPSASTLSSPSRSCSSPSSSSSLAFSTGFRGGFSGEDGNLTTSTSSSPALAVKRKRPARLDIPNFSLGFGAPTATPRGGASAAASVVEEDEDGYYSVYCKRGKRRAAMEDRYSATLNIHGDPKQAFFGVYDGHSGSKAAEYAAENLEKNILEAVERNNLTTSDKRTKIDDVCKEAVKDGYLKTDSDFLSQDLRGGSCCVTAMIRSGDVVVSNAGDCRAVISRGGKAEALTSDHRPSREDEKERIEATGGYIDCYNGVWRIQGSMAVSRAIGDGHMKKWVIAEPETRVYRIEVESEFLILASDGLWDKVTDQEAVDVARSYCVDERKDKKGEALAACKKLAEISVSRGSLDDVSVMVILLQPYHEEGQNN